MSSDEDNEKRPAGESKGIYATAGAEGKDKKDGKKKEDAVVEHGALKKTQEELRKVAFLGEKYGHYKCGTYIRVEIRLDK